VEREKKEKRKKGLLATHVTAIEKEHGGASNNLVEGHFRTPHRNIPLTPGCATHAHSFLFFKSIFIVLYCTF